MKSVLKTIKRLCCMVMPCLENLILFFLRLNTEVEFNPWLHQKFLGSCILLIVSPDEHTDPEESTYVEFALLFQ